MTTETEKRSAINGDGHGSAHNWEYIDTSPFKVSEYRCRDCSAFFRHFYDDVPDIFMAMERQGIAAECSQTK